MRTTISDKAAPCPLDQVNRQFHAPAPNMLWVSDFIRRFINGERPLGDGLLEDTAKALRLLVAEATTAEAQIAAALRVPPTDPS